jgi:error-prone DNA polymerase
MGGLSRPLPPFVHLSVHSGFSFLDGASSVSALVLRAAAWEQPALALTDLHSLTGIVTLTEQCRRAGIRPIGGCEVMLEGGGRLILLADGPVGWSSLCRLLSAASLRDPERKGARVRWEDLEAHRDGVVALSGSPDHGLIPVLVRRRRYEEAVAAARRLRTVFGPGGVYVEVARTLVEGERALSHRLFDLADHLGVAPVATNVVRHATKAGVVAYEAQCRVRLRLAPHEQHVELPFNGERTLKSTEAMAALFADRPDAIGNAARLAQRLSPPLDPAARHLPAYRRLPPGESSFSYLAALAWHGARERYRERLSDAVRSRLIHELETIHALGYSDYFLVCWDLCREAERRHVRYALRGSAVGSAVAYALAMSPHDPIARNISFERFLSTARAKPPDIDIDFRHDERDPICQYLRDTYGNERVGNVANYVTYRARSLLRDLGKALGWDTAEIDRLRELLGHYRGDDLAAQIGKMPELRALGVDPERYGDLFALCAALAGLPRHLGTHSSGILIADRPLAEIVPLQWAARGVTVVALDKDDVEAPGIGLLKLDSLCLRALTAIDLAVESLAKEEEYDNRDRNDPETLAMIRAAQTVGVFQLESPAQMALQWRLKADRFEDLVASVALIRPGPITGGTVGPYLRLRHGWARVVYPLPELESVLRETYGRILYQDQVPEVIQIVGGYTAAEADAFRKALVRARDEEEVLSLGRRLCARARAKGMTRKSFARLWRQIQGFARYGFCHGHAWAFADHAQGTAWLLRHHPAAFLAAVLSVEPCGYWPISTIVAEAVRRGVSCLAPCVNRSAARVWRVERDGKRGFSAIRCALSQVQDLGASAQAIQTEREARGAFVSPLEFCRRCDFLRRPQLEWLVLAGALDTLAPNRRQTLWSLPALCPRKGPRAAGGFSPPLVTGQQAMALEVPPLLPRGLADFSARERFARQWAAIDFSPEGHPLQFYRETLATQGVRPCAALQQAAPGSAVTLAGLVVRPHRPPTPSGKVFVFFTLEDETGIAQVTVPPEVYEQVGSDVFTASALVVTGIAEPRGAGRVLRAQQTSLLT